MLSGVVLNNGAVDINTVFILHVHIFFNVHNRLILCQVLGAVLLSTLLLSLGHEVGSGIHAVQVRVFMNVALDVLICHD